MLHLQTSLITHPQQPVMLPSHREARKRTVPLASQTNSTHPVCTYTQYYRKSNKYSHAHTNTKPHSQSHPSSPHAADLSAHSVEPRRSQCRVESRYTCGALFRQPRVCLCVRICDRLSVLICRRHLASAPVSFSHHQHIYIYQYRWSVYYQQQTVRVCSKAFFSICYFSPDRLRCVLLLLLFVFYIIAACVRMSACICVA